LILDPVERFRLWIGSDGSPRSTVAVRTTEAPGMA
jgi:hypothetical protein